MSRAGLSSKCWRVLRWAGLAAAAPALWACTSRTLEAPVITPTATVTTNFTQKINNEIDILFMVDNSSSMTEMQQKLYDQLPTFMQVLESIPNPPSLHVAVVSSDMGAPGDSTGSIMCTSFGDNGAFQSSPRSDSKLGITCTDSTLATPQNQQNNDNTFISDDNGVKNFTDPDISTVFQCIAFLGDTGCGFEHQLASIDHALGSDNFQPDPNNPGQLIPSPPSTNAGFLRPEAYLGIVILTNEDDCSAPQNTQLYSLNVGGSGQQNIMNALGPIQNYRCNEFGHLCKDPASGDPNALIEPPLNPPNDHQGTAAAPLLAMTDCQSNDTNGLTTPVQQFIDDVKKLKTDPDNQILVAAISAPTAPYAVAWIPEVNGQNTQPGELWPEVLHSCGAIGGPDVNPDPKTQNASDGSFGDPGVRISQFVSAFPNFVQASICDPSYAQSMTAIATKLGQLITPPCITGKIQTDSSGNPMCSVTEHLTDMQGTKSDRTVPGCASNGGALPCWTLAGSTTAGCNGQSLTVTDEPGVSTNMESSTINCSLCLPNSAEPGC